MTEHLDGIIKKTRRKVSALPRIFPSTDITKRRVLMNSFSQFSYQPPICMCHSRTITNKINKLHERCLLWKKSSFKELLEVDKSVPIHIRNLQVLATEMFKACRNISPPIVRPSCAEGLKPPFYGQSRNPQYGHPLFLFFFRPPKHSINIINGRLAE